MPTLISGLESFLDRRFRFLVGGYLSALVGIVAALLVFPFSALWMRLFLLLIASFFVFVLIYFLAIGLSAVWLLIVAAIFMCAVPAADCSSRCLERNS